MGVSESLEEDRENGRCYTEEEGKERNEHTYIRRLRELPIGNITEKDKNSSTMKEKDGYIYIYIYIYIHIQREREGERE